RLSATVVQCVCDHRDLPSFPTRRSSDLSSSRTARRAGKSRQAPTEPSPSCSSTTRSRCSGRPKRQVSISWPATSSTCHALVIRRSEEHTSELQSRENLVCRLLLEKKKI